MRNLFLALHAFIQKNYPDDAPTSLTIRLRGGTELVLPVPVVMPDAPAVKGPARAHSDDFRSVRWDAFQFEFTTTQAIVFGLLWKATQEQTPSVSQEALLEACDRPGRRLRDLFKCGDNVVHPAWGTVIVPGETRGTYRLAP